MAVPGISVSGQQSAVPQKFNYTGSDTLYNGYALCFDHDAATAAARASNVEKPTLAALLAGGFAGIVVNAGPTGVVGNGSSKAVQVIPCPPVEYANRDTNVFTDVNVTAGMLLGPVPSQYALGRAVIPGCAVFRSSEAQNRSVTNGIVNGVYGRINIAEPQYADQISRHFDHFRNPNVPGVVAGALASHSYFLKGTTVMAIAPLAAAAETVINITEGVGELALLGTTSSEAQMQQIGGQYLLSAGRELWCRMRVKIDNISDEDWFWGLGPPPTQSGGVLTGVSMVTDTTAPGGTDYIGFYYDADVDGLGGIQANIRKASGTLQTAASTGTLANNTYIDLSFLARNRLAGTTAGYKTTQFFVNGVISNSFTSAAQAAAFPDTIPLSWIMAGIAGAACCTIDFLDIVEAH